MQNKYEGPTIEALSVSCSYFNDSTKGANVEKKTVLIYLLISVIP
jgi:hypothetical protein